MSRTMSAGLEAHYQSETTTVATCWKATLRNGAVYGFTDHTENITFNSVVYLADAGYTPTSIATTENLSVDNLEVIGMLDDDSIADADIEAGLWDYAEIEIFQVNYKDLTQGALLQRKGWLGEVKTGRTVFTAELRGMMQKLQQNVGELYSPSCRATLGDARCGLNLAPFTFTGTVETVTSNRQFTSSDLVWVDAYFDYGLVTFTGGLNAGISMEVKTYTVGAVLLQLQMPYSVQVGDSFSIVAGCAKRIIEDCKTKFDNVVNFRGEPYFPGTDELYKGPQ
jgi:uncharacterized phage protein (TIGR02218 family)